MWAGLEELPHHPSLHPSSWIQANPLLGQPRGNAPCRENPSATGKGWEKPQGWRGMERGSQGGLLGSLRALAPTSTRRVCQCFRVFHLSPKNWHFARNPKENTLQFAGTMKPQSTEINERKLNCIHPSVQARDFLDLSRKGSISQDGHSLFPTTSAKGRFFLCTEKAAAAGPGGSWRQLSRSPGALTQAGWGTVTRLFHILHPQLCPRGETVGTQGHPQTPPRAWLGCGGQEGELSKAPGACGEISFPAKAG